MPELDIELVRVQAEREAGGRGPDIRGGERGQAGPGAAAGAAPRRSADSPSPDTTVHCTLYSVHCTQHHCPGPGTGELDLTKLTSPATRPLVSITENIKQIQGLFGLVDIHRGF